MSSAVPFSQALRERTWNSHGQSEGAGFMHDLMRGLGTREDYTALVAQHFFLYEALEGAAETMRGDELAASFIDDRLTRLPFIETDLQHLLGDGWREQISPLPATERYVARLNEVATSWNGGFIAHHYTRYLGDLSGGQAIRRRMQQQFGLDYEGVAFYHFAEIGSPAEFKDAYRERLDAVQWSPEEREQVIEEVIAAYALNTAQFEDLSAAKAAAVA